MPEAGGPTTQSGILYQNSVAALFLGRLCDPTARPDREWVIRVRVEAPTEVDDIVVTFADSHCLYIQAKENVRAGDTAWKKLWRDFAKQFRSSDFQRGADRLALYTGTLHEEHHVLRELCERAQGKDTDAEWWKSLTKEQKEQFTHLRLVMDTALMDDGTPNTFASDDDTRQFFASIDIVIWTRDHIERDLLYTWMPSSNQTIQTLFQLLRDRIGREARIRQAFIAPTLCDALRLENNVLFHVPVDMTDLFMAVRNCGALLRQHKHTIAATGLHLRRSIVDDILSWLHEPTDEKRVSMLLDQAGMGKTVVMRDILCELERQHVPVLGIKADQQLSGIRSYTDLAANLQLPESIERVVQRLTTLGRVVVLIDQIDALSLSLARAQTALNIVLDLIARVRLIPGVRILLSCRTFDYHNDPHLRDVDARAPFHLTPLSDEAVDDVLRAIHITSSDVPNITKQLLRIPLHLDLYAQVFGDHHTQVPTVYGPASLTSLQDLYHLLWNDVVLKVEIGSPPEAERVEAIQVLTAYMDYEQQTSVPRSLFLKPDYRHLHHAIRWLTSAGIVIATTTELNFLHQTFFDYCYARTFVEGGRDIVQTVLQSNQDLRARPQMIQVLAYLRGGNQRHYVRALHQLLYAENLRQHLRDLLTRWFGVLPLPTPGEQTLARRLLLDSTQRPLLLAAMHGNVDWFRCLVGAPLQSLLALDDQMLDQQTIPYLASLIDSAQVAIVAILKPYFGHSDAWNRRIAGVLSRVRQWHAVEAADLLEQALPLVPNAYTQFLFELRAFAQVFPHHGCRFLRAMLDQILMHYEIKRQAVVQQRKSQPETVLMMPRLQSELEHLNSHVFIETLTELSTALPDYVVETLVPWLGRVLALPPFWSFDDQYRFHDDELDSSWHDSIYPISHTIIHSLTNALTHLARTTPDLFHYYVERFTLLPYNTPQRLLATVYRNVPEAYADEALQFLLTDQRRFSLGESDRYDTRQLVRAIYPYLTQEQRHAFEEALIAWTFDFPPRDRYSLARRGLHQLMIMQAIPEALLTERSQRYLRELERKFPDFKASDDPRRIREGMVGSPIGYDAARHMSDRDWLRAMRHYTGAVRHVDFLKGGAQELSHLLQALIQEQPERFYSLLDKVPDTVDDAYITAYLSGLAESHAPAEWLFTVVRRFNQQLHRDIDIPIYWALAKRLETPLPEDIRNIVEDGIRAVADSYELGNHREGKDIYNAYLNSKRGTAFRALMGFLKQCDDDPNSIEQRWKLIHFAASDPSPVLRAGAIEELLYVMHLDKLHAVLLFEQLLNGHPTLLYSYYADEFIRHALYKHYDRIQPYIRLMMDADSEECQQRGAELACIAAISPHALETQAHRNDARLLAEEALTGKVTWRRGAARIYAHNIVDGPQVQCATTLQALLNDEDDQVCQHISFLFQRLRAEHVRELQSFLEAFAASRACQREAHFFAEYVWKHSTLFPELTLSLIDTALRNIHVVDTNGGYRSGEEYIRSVLRVYDDVTADDALKHRAMDLFDRLMERFPGQSQFILDEWDRQ